MEVFHSLNASLMRVFGSDVTIVLTSVREKGESLMEQDRGCRPSDPIFPIPGDECVLLCSLLCGILRYRSKTEPLNSRAHIGPYSPIRLSPFSCIEVSAIGTSFLRTSFNRWEPIFTRIFSRN
ncbi:hypothetical protein AVEN_144238-1 [Araneus ventricosus]|uniref:Uncharacterized protein n=1 Tax=Araneus ventricosus TaxID=182803 RepID=A0A4Y2WVE5_ARAVE|nr:hypothetical protein AVEN_234936-1 [Araneus ventricosus]GBO41169.1 hypothetical protein AVEN_243433-1 [Araneus ventricosus]GBO41171.1 hypothetical protein AVEN_25457-1 [Araneus ventricosus]GBO41173.1 hypothetical protein AVEN_144238-1 [Araneus ventricosus]